MLLCIPPLRRSHLAILFLDNYWSSRPALHAHYLDPTSFLGAQFCLRLWRRQMLGPPVQESGCSLLSKQKSPAKQLKCKLPRHLVGGIGWEAENVVGQVMMDGAVCFET